MGRAFELPKDAKCGECKYKIKEDDLYTIIYEDDGSGTIKHLQCDNCEVDDRIKAYRETGEICTSLSTEAAMAKYHLTEGDPKMAHLREEARHFFLKYKKDLLEIAQGSDQIHEMIHAFEAKHWLGYVKEYWNTTDLRGHEAKVGKIKLMMWGCAGRVLMTVQEGDDNFTMIFTDEKSQVKPNGGQQGIYCTQKKAKELLTQITNVEKINFKPDKNVRMAGL